MIIKKILLMVTIGMTPKPIKILKKIKNNKKFKCNKLKKKRLLKHNEPKLLSIPVIVVKNLTPFSMLLGRMGIERRIIGMVMGMYCGMG